MAEVLPFAGLRFAGAALADVIAPPYDVISEEEQARLYDRSPHNVVRLELGREPDRYAEARRCLREWLQAGALRRDEPSLYLYEQRFTPPGVTGRAEGAQRRRRGLIARVRLEPWSAGVILPHEETLTKPKADRLDLLRAVQANVSPVFGLYEDPDGRLASLLDGLYAQPPLANARDEAGEDHLLWRVPAGDTCRQVSEAFAGKPLFIADGHHRYETALAYRDEQARARPGRWGEASLPDYVMMALVDFADPGLVVLPAHRLMLGLSGERMGDLARGLADYFDVVAAAEEASPRAVEAALRQLEALEGPGFALYGPTPAGLRVVELKPAWRGAAFDAGRSDAWNGLDVAVLHSILARLLGLAEDDLAGERYFRYTRDPLAAIAEVRRGDAQLAWLVRPTPATAIRDVALARDKMPQKSTYFYPKLATGLVLNPLAGLVEDATA